MIQWHEHTADHVALPDLTAADAEAPYASLATIAAAAVGAEAGLVILPPAVVHLVGGAAHLTAARRGIPMDPGPEPGSTAWSRLVDGLRTITRHATTLADLRDHALFADLDEDDLGGLVSYAGIPLRDEHGGILGLLGVLDTVPRDWTGAELAVLDDLGRLVRTGGAVPASRDPRGDAADDTTRAAAGIDASPGLATVARDMVAGLDHATAGLDALLSRAEEQGDPVLQRRAGIVHGHLDALRTQATRVRAELASGSHDKAPLTRFDLGALTRNVVEEICAREEIAPLSCAIEQTSLTVHADRAGLRRTITSLLESALLAAPPSAVTLRVSSHAFASELLEGSLTAEFHLQVDGATLDPADLCRALAPGAGSVSPPSGPSARIAVSGGEVHLAAPGLEARLTPWGSAVVVRRPLDLG